MPKALMMPGAMAKAALMRLSCTSSAGPGSSGRASRRCAGHRLIAFPALLKGEILSASTFAPPIQSEVKPLANDRRRRFAPRRSAPDRVVQQKVDREARRRAASARACWRDRRSSRRKCWRDSDRAGNDMVSRGERFGERRHIAAGLSRARARAHQRIFARCKLCVPVKLQIEEKRQLEGRGGFVGQHGGIEHRRAMVRSPSTNSICRKPHPDGAAPPAGPRRKRLRAMP